MSRAVVIGASLAGSLCARVLTEHFDEVLVVERDHELQAMGPRRAVPQGHHLHALWHTGLVAMEQLYPGLTDELIAGGAVPSDAGYDSGWWHLGRRRVPVRLGTNSLMMSRPFLESTVRARMLALPNLQLRRARVDGLDATTRGVNAVLVASHEQNGRERLGADLVVDCSGRASQLGTWLASLGYQPPRQEQVAMDIGYATRLFRRRPSERLGDGTAGLVCLAAPPARRRGAAVAAIEGGRWLVTLAGYADDRPTADEADFAARCRDERVAPLDELIEGTEAVSEVVTYRMPTSIRRAFHKMPRFPRGLFVAGDSVASFNPIYGQGMTCAAFHAQTLRLHLQRTQRSPGKYLRTLKEITNRAWAVSVSEDFRLATTKGRRPPGTALSHRLGNRYALATLVDPELHRLFLRVASMELGPASLLTPSALLALRKSTRSPRSHAALGGPQIGRP